MKNYALKDIHPDDIEDLLFKIEESFAIRFAQDELQCINTFGQLCDHITDKMLLEHKDDCSSQQAFYKMREAMVKVWALDPKAITPDAPIVLLLPRRGRRARVMQLEAYLGFKLHILRPPNWLKVVFISVLLASLGILAFNVFLGIALLVFALAGLWYMQQRGIETDLKTMGDLVQNMMRKNYVAVRRNPGTFNKEEIQKVLTDWFSDALDLNKRVLGRDAPFT